MPPDPKQHPAGALSPLSGDHHRSASAPNAFSRLISGTHNSSGLVSPWQPAEPHVSPAPSFDWPEIRIHERVSETKSDRQLSHLRSRDSSSPDVALQLDTLSPQPSQSLQNEAQELVEREASSSSKVSHEYRPLPPSRRVYDGTWRGSNGRFAYLFHMLHLAGCEYPMSEHRQWLGVTQMPKGSGVEAVRTRPPLKRRLLMGMGAAQVRFVPLDTSLEEAYAGNRKRRRLLYALRRHHTHSYASLWDRLANETFIHCQLLFDRCTPRKLRAHLPWACSAYLIICCIAFAFMAGEYSTFLASMPDPHSQACARRGTQSGPQSLWTWLIKWDDCHIFDSHFLIMWGARYAPKLTQAQQWWRWFSSFVVFDSFGAFATNSLLFTALGMHIESRFTTRRTIFFILLSGVGGNFFDASFGGACEVVTSGAAVTAGFVGLYVADFSLNFQSIKYPIKRLVIALVCLACFVLSCTLNSYPYRYTIAGGFLAALFPSLLMLPHLRSETIEWTIPLLALFFTLGICLALPLYVYLVRLPDAHCQMPQN